VSAASYVTTAPVGAGTTSDDCTGKTGAALDQCEWGNQLRGAAEQVGGASAGAMINALGCISQVSANPAVYQVSVSWQGTSNLGTPSLSCGSGSYPRETLRRTIGAIVPIACLTC
jgi:type IV pilus assembly protein PilV